MGTSLLTAKLANEAFVYNWITLCSWAAHLKCTETNKKSVAQDYNSRQYISGKD